MHKGVVAARAVQALQDQRKGVLAHRVGAVASRIADGDPVSAAVVDVDIVITRGEESDVFQMIGKAQGFGIERCFVADDHIRIAYGFGNIVIGGQLVDGYFSEFLQRAEAQVAVGHGFCIGQDNLHSAPRFTSLLLL